jgi:tetratricopeptide (TPR) repeat protein
LLAAAGKKLPALFPPRVILAKLFVLNNQAAEARAALEQAAAEYPEHPENYLLFGQLALREGRTTDAAVHFDKAAALADGDKWGADVKQRLRGEALLGLTSVAERRKDLKAAEAALAACLKLDPKNAKARERLGMNLFRQGQRDRAREELQQACKDDPKLDAAAVTMGRLYNEAGDLKEAEKWLELAAGEGGQRAHLVYADWLLARARPQEAKKQAEAAAKADPDSADVQFLRGLIAWHLHDFDEAEKIFIALHVASPGNFAASNNLALALAEQADAAKRRRGLELAQVNARLEPNSGEALSTLGRACYRNGRLEEAEQALRASIATGSASSDTAYYLARVLSERGRVEEVKTLLKVALDAPGLFTYRKEAREWADRLNKKP